MINWEKTQKKFDITSLDGFRPKVVINCDKCNKEAIITIRVKSKVVNNQLKWECQKCVGQRQEIKEVLSIKTKHSWKSSSYRDTITQKSKNKWSDEEYVDKIKLSKQEFISKMSLIHDNRYTYLEFNGMSNDVAIICPIHGEFTQLASNHHKGHGCPKCSDSKLTTEEFIEKSSLIHRNKYGYTKASYTGCSKHIIITCPIHGDFKQLAISHYNGNNCPKCAIKISNGQQEIIDFITEPKVVNDREIIKPYELDILIPTKNIAIEYNGLYWHSTTDKSNKRQHYNKTDVCVQKGIQLIQIFEDEWINKKEIVKSIINSKLGKNNRVFARNCSIKILSSHEFNEFCNKCHMQGELNSKIKLGLIFENEIQCAIGFNKHKEYDYECTRFCNKLNINVIGGASRLFNFFIKQHNPRTVLSYADRRYSNGNLYKTLKFNLIGITNPGYFYTKNSSRFSRQKFQKHKLKKILKHFDNSLSEFQNMINNGYRILFDAGHYRYLWTSDNINC